MGQFGIGQPVRRKEDVRLLTGKGVYTDDVNIDGQVFGVFVRSPQAHAVINAIDIETALAAEGVVAIYTGEDLAADGVGTLETEVEMADLAGNPMFRPKRTLLATGKVRFLGEPVAIVLAETQEQARAAAELVMVDYDQLPSIASTAGAVDPSSPPVWPEHGSNVSVHWENRPASEIDVHMERAKTRVTVDIVNNRLVPNPMEPRAAVAHFDAATGMMTLYAPTQGGRRIQGGLAKGILKIPADKMRVISQDTGGGFGIRGKLYPELGVVCWAARRSGRPVKWRGDRNETFVSDYHGRDQVNHAELGLDENGRVVALKVHTILNVGAYMGENGPRLPISGGGRIIPGVYDIENFYFSVKPVFTNTVPTDTYRGAGRPEANFLMERLMDAAADATGLARDEIRRRNVIRQDQMPYMTQMGLLIDSGDFIGNMDMAMEHSDWKGFEARRNESEKNGKLRGIGLGNFVEAAGGRPTEEMRVRISADGKATVFAGTYSHGQGHETVYAQLIEEYLGVPFDDVSLVQGDTATSPMGSAGTFGSRSSWMGGLGIRRSSDAIVAKGKKIAAKLLQGDEEAVSFENGVFSAGAGSVTIQEVAKAAQEAKNLPEGMEPGLDESFNVKRDAELFNFPNGCHVCEVEIDPDLGIAQIVGYTAVDDCGVVLNPFIVHGQVYGGIAQGIGQALTENTVYDAEGQLMTGSFMDYGMPKAQHFSHIEALFNEVRCKTNDLGVKGAGEAGACGAPSAFVSAVMNALSPYGIKHIDMPLTPDRIWQAIADAKSAKAA
ncbi:MAG: xanthine dehydrogenase family protein molybdopterin-binding subunit [Beijerinckiaceae bacterium]|nr:xanthine dehydrogenase family protein molybdopterin-binding subunit [Beijerinckiaceae bacterium]